MIIQSEIENSTNDMIPVGVSDAQRDAVLRDHKRRELLAQLAACVDGINAGRGMKFFRLFTEPPCTSTFLQAIDQIGKTMHTAYEKALKQSPHSSKRHNSLWR
jgi:hypothetical protein